MAASPAAAAHFLRQGAQWGSAGKHMRWMTVGQPTSVVRGDGEGPTSSVVDESMPASNGGMAGAAKDAAKWGSLYFELGKGKLSGLVTFTAAAG